MFRKAVATGEIAETPRKPLTATLLDGLTLKAHGLAIRLDRVPDHFGDAGPVDETDPAAIRREWLRLVHAWSDYSPEEVFALKAGALMLGGALVAILIVVAAI